jgi:hypothetical protein
LRASRQNALVRCGIMVNRSVENFHFACQLISKERVQRLQVITMTLNVFRSALD